MIIIIESVSIIAAIISLTGTLIYVFYEHLPYKIVTVTNTSIVEKALGNSVVITVWIYYDVENTRRYSRVVLSGSKRKKPKLLAQATQLEETHKQRSVKYFGVPGISRWGILDGTVTRQQVLVGIVLTVTFIIVSAISIL